MGLPDLSNVKWRNFASFGAIVGGTTLACCATGGLAGIGAGLVSVFSSVAAADAGKAWAEKRRSAKYAHPNEDLVRLVAKAIAHEFFQCAKDKKHAKHAKWFRTLGEVAEKQYIAVAEHPAFDSLSSANLPKLFEAAASNNGQYRVDSVNWAGLTKFLRGQAKQPENPEAEAIAIERLAVGTFANIREMFKRDFEGNGRAFPALCIDMNGEILARLTAIAADCQGTLEQLKIQRSDLIEIKSILQTRFEQHLTALSSELKTGLSDLLAEFSGLNQKADETLTRLERIETHTERTEQRTERIEGRQLADSKTLARIEQRLTEQFAQKTPGDDPSQQQLPPDLIEQAKVLRERGNEEQRATAEIALKLHLEADAIIQKLKKGPMAELHRLLMLEGDNWYRAGEFDKAVEPYENALTLRPDDLTTRHNVTIARASARLGDIAAHRKRAIQVATESLRLAFPHPIMVVQINEPTGASRIFFPRSNFWATMLNTLGAVWATMPTIGDGNNLKRAIACFRRSLTVRTRESHPTDWAMTQSNLGNCWHRLPTGNRRHNISNAIACHKAALTVYTRHKHPVDWAVTLCNLGSAWVDLPIKVRTRSIQKGFACFKAALTVFTRESYPADWAMTQNNLGMAWAELPTNDKKTAVKEAIAYFTNALTVYKEDTYPTEWAQTMVNLGTAWADLPTDDREHSTVEETSCYNDALRVFTREKHALDWANVQHNLAKAFSQLAQRNPIVACESLRKAIACGKGALLVTTAFHFPHKHASTMHNLSIDRQAYESAGCHNEIPFDDIKPAE